MGALFRKPRLNSSSPIELILTYGALLVWLAICLFPLYWLGTTSFKIQIDVYGGPKYLPFVDYQPSLNAWTSILSQSSTWRPYINTVVIALASTLLALTLGASAAYALVRFRFRVKIGLVVAFLLTSVGAIAAMLSGVPWPVAVASGIAIYFLLALTLGRRFTASLGNKDIAFWIISQRILPPIAVVIPIYFLFLNLNLLDSYLALVLTYAAANLPIVVWLLRDFFNGIPLELDESALVDGANRFQVFYKIILPLSVPGLVATFIFTLVFAWNEYIFALFISRGGTQTLPLLVAAQQNTRGTQWWDLSVLVLIMILPVILIAILLERYIEKGLLIGAIKE